MPKLTEDEFVEIVACRRIYNGNGKGASQLEFYSQFAGKETAEYVDKNILARMEKMMAGLKIWIGRRMSKLVVESTKKVRPII